MKHHDKENRTENFDEDSDIRAESRKLSRQRLDYSLHFSLTQSAPEQREGRTSITARVGGFQIFPASRIRVVEDRSPPIPKNKRIKNERYPQILYY